jgi:hydroxymethylpyrimidine/phosphomethylpyrimidine kinase
VQDGVEATLFTAPRVATKNTHGTGCTLSSAIAALLPQRPTVATAVRDAREYLLGAIRASGELEVGSGHGPLNHFHEVWPRRRTVTGEAA